MSAPRTTYDGEPIVDAAPFGATIVVFRRVKGAIQLLVLHRAHNGPAYEGDWAWTPPAGACKPGESVDGCARRELGEETGLDIAITATALGGDWPAYLAEAAEDATVVLHAEHDRFAWLAPADALARCRPDVVAQQIRAALRVIKSGGR